jgi:transmembrane sensor
VELNTGAKVDVKYTPGERRVQLLSGEALFSVAKNPQRPFIVSAGTLSVRAVGTAFTVALNREAVSVLVTEGKVHLDEAPAQTGDHSTNALVELSNLVAGQRAVLAMPVQQPVEASVEIPRPVLQIREVTPVEIERALSWQGMRLEFIDMSLRDVVYEFNRYNKRKLVVADAQTAAIVVGGNFRADNIDTFVRLLNAGFGVTASVRGNEILLSRAR